MTPTALRTAELGATRLKITRVGFGAWAIGGGGYEGGWGPQDDEDSIALGPVPPELMALWIDVVGIMGADALESFVTRTRRSWSSAATR